MKKLEILSNVFSVFGLMSMAVFQLTKESVRWPGFIANNFEFISFGSIGLGYILTVIYYFLTKNAKKAIQLLLFAAIMTAVCFALYFLGK